MFDPIDITITGITSTDEGITITCTWQWGTREPRSLTIPIEKRPDTAEEAREVVNRWVRHDAWFESMWAPVRDELLNNRWSIELGDDDDDDEDDLDSFVPFDPWPLEYN